tara:strand:+ start:38 stop:298 length:261 start_codon:yes stop_codon:yes gene_type:complete
VVLVVEQHIIINLHLDQEIPLQLLLLKEIMEAVVVQVPLNMEVVVAEALLQLEQMEQQLLVEMVELELEQGLQYQLVMEHPVQLVL